MTIKPATPLFTAQEMFTAVAADPRVKAHPNLVQALRNITSAIDGSQAQAVQIGKAAELLRELGEAE